MTHCKKCNSIKKLTKEESNKLKKVLDDLQCKVYQETGIFRLSGGFTTAEIIGYDNDYVKIKLLWGVQNDCENRKYKRQYKINRQTLEVE